MKKHITYIFSLLVTISWLVCPSNAISGTYTSTFWNEFRTDSIHLFLDDDSNRHDVIFQNVTFSDTNWSIARQSDTYLHLSGPEADPWNISFTLSFTDNRRASRILPFTLEWAEYMNGGPSATGAMGSIELNRRGSNYNWVASNEFNSVIPNPIPASTWLLLSGICFLVGVRRHTRS